MAPPRLVAALDIGSSKVCCFVARPDGHGGARVAGIGHQISRGLRAGAVVDMEAAEESVRAAVDAAERMAGETVKSVYVNLSGGKPSSQVVPAEVQLNGRQIGEGEIRRLLAHAKTRCEGADAKALHVIPTGFSIDGASRIADPRGMYGDRLGVSLHVVTAASGPMRNLRTVTERCHLQIEDFCASPYASALSALVSDEMDLGVTLVDMGGGCTGIAVFYDGAMVHTEIVPIGGGHVTSDIARGLSTPASHAERMKTLYGSAIPSPADEREMIAVPQVGETGADSVQQIPRSMLVGIIQPRIEETLELVRERLERSGFGRAAGRRLVLTGGACQLTGVRELAARVLDKQVRIGRPLRMQGLAEATEGPAFATCAGLIAYAIRRPREARAEAEPELVGAGGRFAGFARWLKENF